MNIFAQASKDDLLFKSKKGTIGLSDLWTFPVASLKDMANTINRNTKKSDDLFATTSSSDVTDKLRLDIILEVLAIRASEASAKVDAVETEQKRTLLKGLIQQKKLEATSSMSIEALEAELAKT